MKDFESGIESFVDSTEKTGGRNGLLLLIPLAIMVVMAAAGVLRAQPEITDMLEAQNLGIEQQPVAEVVALAE